MFEPGWLILFQVTGAIRVLEEVQKKSSVVISVCSFTYSLVAHKLNTSVGCQLWAGFEEKTNAAEALRGVKRRRITVEANNGNTARLAASSTRGRDPALKKAHLAIYLFPLFPYLFGNFTIIPR